MAEDKPPSKGTEVESPPTQAPSDRILPLVGTFSQVATPITLAITGTLYVCGWIFKAVQLDRFGLSSDQFGESVQATLARGYVSVLGLLACILVMTGLSWVMSKLNMLTVFDLLVEFEYNAITVAIGITGMLTVGVATGLLIENAESDILSRPFERGSCGDCFRYIFRDGRSVLGRMLAADEERVAIFTRSGVFIAKQDALLLVKPVVIRRTGQPR